jgi:polysaccharide pyruvyl transferase WcaK-like protein
MLNSGDDALMCSAHWGARVHLNSEPILTSSASATQVDRYTIIPAFPKSKFRGHRRLLHYLNAWQSEKVIFGGGSGIHSEKDINFKNHLVKLAGGKRSRCIGIGIEEFESVRAERACAKFLNNCGFVGIRDKYSFEVASSIAPNANIHLTFDLAPTMLKHGIWDIQPIRRKGIMMNFCQLPHDGLNLENRQQLLERVNTAIAIIVNSWEMLKESIYLLDFNGHPIYGDFHVHERIINGLPEHIDINHISYDPNPYRVLQRIASFKAVVAMRLHAAIMAFMVNTPCLPITYHKKCIGWCNQIGVPTEYRFEAHELTTDGIPNQLVKGITAGFFKSDLSIDNAIGAAMSNWSYQ